MFVARAASATRRSLAGPAALAAAAAITLAADLPCAAQDEPALAEPPVELRAPTLDYGAGWRLTTDVVGGVNPRSFSTELGAAYRHVYGRDPASTLFDGLYLQGGLTLAPNPAWVQLSPHVEAVPLAPLQLRLQYDLYRFFGDYDALLSFPDRRAPFGDRARDALDGAEETGWGHRLLFRPTVRLRLGPLIARNQTDLALYWLPARGPYVLELEYDTLLRRGRDILVANRTQLLFELWDGPGDATLLVGPQYEVVHALGAGLTRQRIGGLVAFVPVATLGPFARPRLYLSAGYNLRDPNREREGYVAGGIGFDFDL